MKKKKIIVLITACVIIAAITWLGGFCMNVKTTWLSILLLALVNLCNAGTAAAAMKITGMKLNPDFRNIKQYGIGILIAAGLTLIIGLIPVWCGFSLVGSHKDFTWFRIIYSFLNFVLIIGPVEELIFRVYIQDTLVSLFDNKKAKFAGVIISSLIFGLWHLINGSLIQVLFTFVIGLVFGFCKYLIKDCKYPGLALGHGLYDFMTEIICMFVI